MQSSLLFLIKITRGLSITSMALGIYLIYNSFMVKEPAVTINFRPTKVAPVSASNLKPVSRADFESYADVFKRRDFFEGPLDQFQQRRRQPIEDKPQPIVFDLTTQYKLVGIILDDNPQAIIEDLIRKETLFLSIGDKVDGAVLKEIMPGKVHFTYQGNLLELVQ